MSAAERLCIVCYDVRHPRRWRRLFRIMKGYGEWLQLSVFQCRLDAQRRVTLELELTEVIRVDEDHVLIIDIGPADQVAPRFHSLGQTFDPLERGPLIV